LDSSNPRKLDDYDYDQTLDCLTWLKSCDDFETTLSVGSSGTRSLELEIRLVLVWLMLSRNWLVTVTWSWTLLGNERKHCKHQNWWWQYVGFKSQTTTLIITSLFIQDDLFNNLVQHKWCVTGTGHLRIKCFYCWWCI
jgi:hypothetical protein